MKRTKNNNGMITHSWYPPTHDDVIKWNHFPRYWPFVRGIHRSPVNSPHKGQWHGALMFSLICNKRLSKQWWGWWFETLSWPLWRHRNDRSFSQNNSVKLESDTWYHHPRCHQCVLSWNLKTFQSHNVTLSMPSSSQNNRIWHTLLCWLLICSQI